MVKNRVSRVQELVKRGISDILLAEMNDPQMKDVTVFEVQMSKDLKHAKVFISILGEMRHRLKVIDKINNRSGYIQYLLGKNVRLKYVPELMFLLDQRIDHYQRIERILQEVSSEDDHPDQEDL